MRYRLICVAPELPDLMSTDDLDEAIANSTPNYEVYDDHEHAWVPIGPEDYDEAIARLKARHA